MSRLRARITLAFIGVLILLPQTPRAQGTAPPVPLTLVTREARRPVPTTIVSGQELIALDDVAALFQVTVREDTLAGGITVTYRNRTIVASPDQPMASVNGRVVTLPAAVSRAGRRWLVPLEFLSRALAPIYDQRIDLRRASRLLIVGDLRVPRVSARIDAVGPPTRATIELDPAVPVQATTDNGRVLLRVEADALDLGLPADGGGLIDVIRAGDQPNSIAVVLLPAAAPPRVASTAADGVARVTIEVPAIAAATDTAAPSRPSIPVEPLPVGMPRPAVGTIVIDPGHGGDDVGAKGANGVEEKTVTLDIARRLRNLIETRLGLRVALTRDDDRGVAADARAAFANNSKADVFLSLHASASLSAAAAGAEVYHLKLDREGEQARRDAAASAVTLPALNGAPRRLDFIRWDLAQARHVERSATLAGLVAEELTKLVPVGARPVRQAPLRVLEGADMPAALVEVGYLTNAEQEKLAASESFRHGVAQALFETIVRFRALVDAEGR